MFLQKNKVTILSLGLTCYVYAGEDYPVETFWIWVALFALAVIGITILFVSSRQTMKVQKLHQDMLKKQLEMEKNQNILLTNMSENIHKIAKQALDKKDGIVTQTEELIQNKEDVLNSVERKLLTVTTDLIDFLRLKSKKIYITHEKFNINNVLNELSGSICKRFSGRNTEIIFDIDHNVPRFMLGDSLHLGQVLHNILDHIMEHFSSNEVKLEISMFNTFDNKIELQFKFTDTSLGMDTHQLETLFIPYYNEDEATYVGLGLFVAHELISMMNGELGVQSILGKGNIFTLTLPFAMDSTLDQRVYRLPQKVFCERKVFIVDTNYNAALAIKKSFAYFKHEVRVMGKDNFLKNMPSLEPYDIIILNENLFSIRLVEYLKKIKSTKELKIIALNALIHSQGDSFVNDIIDIHLFKPLNQERILEMIIDMYDIKVSTAYHLEHKTDMQLAKIHKGLIVASKNITHTNFKDFKGKNVLIAEDNLINQRVLISLLHESGMHISVANNGQEAVDLLKKNTISFDLVLMDINMPIMDGYTATQMIRLDQRFDSVPVIAFTALVLESEIRKMFNCGINAFLEKPLNIGKLYTAFSMYLLETPIGSEINEIVKKEYENYAGIDIQHGISKTNGNETLYMEVIYEFNSVYGDSAALFKKLVLEHRYEQIKILCMDLRGLTGAICADDMHHLVTEIYQCLLYKKQALLPNYIERYTFEMNTLRKSIEAITSQ